MVGKIINDTLKWVSGGRIDLNKTAQQANIDFINKLGLINDDRMDIEKIFDSDEVKIGGTTAKIVLTRGDISHDRNNFDKVDANLDIMEMIDGFNKTHEKYKKRNNNEIDSEIIEAIQKITGKAKQCQFIGIGSVMPRLDDNKNLVIDKPILLEGSNRGALTIPDLENIAKLQDVRNDE